MAKALFCYVRRITRSEFPVCCFSFFMQTGVLQACTQPQQPLWRSFRRQLPGRLVGEKTKFSDRPARYFRSFVSEWAAHTLGVEHVTLTRSSSPQSHVIYQVHTRHGHLESYQVLFSIRARARTNFPTTESGSIPRFGAMLRKALQRAQEIQRIRHILFPSVISKDQPLKNLFSVS